MWWTDNKYTEITLQICETMTMSTLNTSFKFHFGHILTWKRETIYRCTACCILQAQQNIINNSSSNLPHIRFIIWSRECFGCVYIYRDFRYKISVSLSSIISYCTIQKLKILASSAKATTTNFTLTMQTVFFVPGIFRHYYYYFFFLHTNGLHW